MGGYAALEYSKFQPNQVAAVACIAGYYDTRCANSLMQTIAHIPLLFVHYTRDKVCPIAPVKQLLEVRRNLSKVLTEARILDGDEHCGDEIERQKALDWLHSVPR